MNTTTIPSTAMLIVRALVIAMTCLMASGAWAQSANDVLELTSHHATASVESLDRMIEWYQDKLGFKLVLRQQQSAIREIAWLTIPGYRLDLIQMKGSLKRPQTKVRMMVQGWEQVVFSVPNVDRAYAILKTRGVTLPEPVTTNEALHIRTFHFQDAEGNWLEIFQDVSKQN